MNTGTRSAAQARVPAQRSPEWAAAEHAHGRRDGLPAAAQVVTALSLPRTRAAHARQARPLPVTQLRQLPRDGSMLYGIGKVDTSGRVASSEITAALGWQPGDRLDMALTTTAIVFSKSPDGMLSVPHKPCVMIPAVARHRHAIAAGDDVLLAAAPGFGVVIVHPMSALDDMITRYHSSAPPDDSQ